MRWLAADEAAVASHFYLVRELAAALPRSGDAGLATRVRALAKTIADADPRFMELRGQDPRPARRRRRDAGCGLPPGPSRALVPRAPRRAAGAGARLARSVPGGPSRVPARLRRGLSWSGPRGFSATPGARRPGQRRSGGRGRGALSPDVGRCATRCRLQASRRSVAFALLDLSLAGERALMAVAAEWRPTHLRDLLRQNLALGRAVAGTGLLERWEWKELERVLEPAPARDAISVEDLALRARLSRRSVEWSAGMVRCGVGLGRRALGGLRAEGPRPGRRARSGHGAAAARRRLCSTRRVGGDPQWAAELRARAALSRRDPRHQPGPRPGPSSSRRPPTRGTAVLVGRDLRPAAPPGG